ncbi:MAG: hypothetical protein JWP20_2629 [Roseomonas sp.]|nr:hypothetical protein [Roseomonas sp.]
MSSSIDSWDEVWDAYEASQLKAVAVPPRRIAARRGTRCRRGVAALLLPVAMFGLGCMAGSAWPVLNLYALAAGQDVPALLRLVDLRPAREGLRQALRDHAGLALEPGSGGAARLLSAMADDMAMALARPGALEQVILARQDGAWARDPALAPLQWLRPGWRDGISLDLGPREGAGGFGFDLAWTGQGWRAVSIRLLDGPVTEGGAAVRAVGAWGPGMAQGGPLRG